MKRLVVWVLCLTVVVGAVGGYVLWPRDQVFRVCNHFPPDHSPAEVAEAREAGMLAKDPCGEYYIESELVGR